MLFEKSSRGPKDDLINNQIEFLLSRHLWESVIYLLFLRCLPFCVEPLIHKKIQNANEISLK